VPLGVLLAAVIVKSDLPCPPAVIVTVAVLRVTVGPLSTTGEMVAVRLMVPENLFKLDSVIVDVPEDPLGMDRLAGLEAMLKLDTRRVTGAESFNAPLVAVTVTV
jgi:hypothetical protein